MKNDKQLDFRKYPYQARHHHLFQKQKDGITSCQPDNSQHDSCLGDDQLILSAICNERGRKQEGATNQVSMMWSDIVESLFRDASEIHDQLQYTFESIITGNVSAADVLFEKDDKSLYFKEHNDSLWKSNQTVLQKTLLKHTEEIMSVDWLDAGFPKHISDDCAIIPEKRQGHH